MCKMAARRGCEVSIDCLLSVIVAGIRVRYYIRDNYGGLLALMSDAEGRGEPETGEKDGNIRGRSAGHSESPIS